MACPENSKFLVNGEDSINLYVLRGVQDSFYYAKRDGEFVSLHMLKIDINEEHTCLDIK